MKQLPTELQAPYAAYPYPVRATPWSTFKGKKGPWTIGYISFPIANAWKINYFNQLKKDFALAKSKGLVDGSLKSYIQPNFNTATPEQQSAAIQQMVRDGVDAIILHPLNSKAVTPAIDAAGKAGVPVILQGDVAPESAYAINNWSPVNNLGQAAFLKMLYNDGWFRGETRTTIAIRGIQGSAIEQSIHDAAAAEMKACRGIDVLDTMFTNWNPVTTKSSVLTFLASHPQKIDFVMNEDAVSAGVIGAFEQAGRAVPPQPMNQSSGGDYSWWLKNKNAYKTIGYCFGGKMVAYTDFRLMLRILGGRQLKLRDIVPAGVVVTSANISKYAEVGKPLTYLGDLVSPANAWLNNAQMNSFFVKPGTPGGL